MQVMQVLRKHSWELQARANCSNIGLAELKASSVLLVMGVALYLWPVWKFTRVLNKRIQFGLPLLVAPTLAEHQEQQPQICAAGALSPYARRPEVHRNVWDPADFHCLFWQLVSSL